MTLTNLITGHGPAHVDRIHGPACATFVLLAALLSSTGSAAEMVAVAEYRAAEPYERTISIRPSRAREAEALPIPQECLNETGAAAYHRPTQTGALVLCRSAKEPPRDGREIPVRQVRSAP